MNSFQKRYLVSTYVYLDNPLFGLFKYFKFFLNSQIKTSSAEQVLKVKSKLQNFDQMIDDLLQQKNSFETDLPLALSLKF